MPNLNFLLFLNTYSDSRSTNSPQLNNFKWTRELDGLSVSNPDSDAFVLAPGETKTLINGIRSLAQDNTTQYSIALKSLSTNTYVLSWVGGVAPNFRTPRSTGADATTKVVATQNGPLITFTGAAVSAVAASFVGQIPGMTTNVTIAAVTAGSAGNTIAITANGTSTLNQLIVAYNGAHPSNQTVLQAGDDTQIPTSGGVIILSGGVDSATALNLSSVQVGDYVRLGNLFNLNNQSEQKIIAVTSTSFTVNNELGVPEGPITLGSGFASQLQIYSAAGVQVGDTVRISGGFSLVTQGDYKVSSVGANFLEFFSADTLPAEGPITTQAIAIYSSAKKLVYLESNQHVSMIINNVSGEEIEPLVINNSTVPGMFLRTSLIYSMSVTNVSTDTASLFLASVE